MSDLQLPVQELMLLRDLKKTVIVLLLFLRFDPKPVGRDDVSRLLDLSKPTAAEYLHNLSLHGLITRQGHFGGYILSEGGKQLMLGQIPQIGQEASENGKNFLPSEKLVKDSIVNSLIEDSRDSKNFLPYSENFSLSSVLSLAPALFGGDQISAKGLDGVDPVAALKWVAYVYGCKSRYHSPCGMIYSRLKKREEPPEGSNVYGLPAHILKILGIEIPADQNIPGIYQEDDEQEETPALIVCEEIDETVTDAVLELWEKIKAALRSEMATAAFQTWVADISPLSWRGNVLTLGCRNEYQCRWLESHLSGFTFAELPDTKLRFVLEKVVEE